jgi:hypothetical protein
MKAWNPQRSRAPQTRDRASSDVIGDARRKSIGRRAVDRPAPSLRKRTSFRAVGTK